MPQQPSGNWFVLNEQNINVSGSGWLNIPLYSHQHVVSKSLGTYYIIANKNVDVNV